jgi:hypothetical protein
VLWARLASKRESAYLLVLWARFVRCGRESVFLVLWARLASKRGFTGARGTIRTILGAKNGVFTSAWTTNWTGNIGVWNWQCAQDRAYDTSALEMGLKLLS